MGCDYPRLSVVSVKADTSVLAEIAHFGFSYIGTETITVHLSFLIDLLALKLVHICSDCQMWIIFANLKPQTI